MPDQPRVPSLPGQDPGLAQLQKVLEAWRHALLDMGGRNRLLNFKHTKTASLEITDPPVAELLAGLAGGWRLSPARASDEPVDLTPAGRRARGLVTQKTSQASLDSSLYLLRQRSAQMYNDYGLWVLWLGIGMLEWCEEGGYEPSSAPLVLVPVELRRDSDRSYRLHPAEGQDRTHNPALAVKMERLGIDWSAVSGTDATDTEAVLSAASRVAGAQKGWSVMSSAVIGLFASHREAMYQDLHQNEEQILGHPLVRAIGLGPDSGLPDDFMGFEPPPLDAIDEIQLPERTPLVLDADASQRQCIATALAGRSFVMSGPPGTGKSQTITNMIAALMHAGRSVLFVSEKAAALDVVRNRLRGVGLGDFVLALHSGDTGKKAVATELARVLTTEARVTGAAEHELERARRLREELSAYAAAMNQPREPLERSLHDVMGRLVRLDQAETPRLPLAARGARRAEVLSAGALVELISAAEALGRAWRPAVEREAFPWRGLLETSPHESVTEAADALGAVRTAASHHPFAGGTDAPRTVRDLERAVMVLRDRLPFVTAPADGGLPDGVAGQVGQLAGLFGLSPADGADAAFDLCELADLTTVEHRPPRGWFTTDGLAAAHAAVREIRQAVEAADRAGVAAREHFGDQVLAMEDLDGLVHRFAEQHTGVLSRFSKQFKADRETAAGLTRAGSWDKSLVPHLKRALDWQAAVAEATRLTEAHAEAVGRRAVRTVADVDELERILAVADRIAELTKGAPSVERVADRLADGSDPDPLPTLLAGNVRRTLGEWCEATAMRVRRWTTAVAELLDAFDDVRKGQLASALHGTFDEARAAVADLLDDPQGPGEWRAYRDAIAVLTRHGAEGLVPAVVESGIGPARLPDIVEQAVLRSWADGILSADARLRQTRSEDLDARVADFQEADRRLIAAAGGAVIEACNARRPRGLGGGAPGLITREAAKKTRHMPVRELLGRTRDVVQAIKPCFMMSPLTVSQFLPADYTFDVVVFDEASQVRPSDAVNCIYRGHSLVVAGDEKQLPPTSFFDAAVDDDGDEYAEDVPDSFESLLHACKAGAMRELPLLWHYRSRHENLITFSNREFYQNSMVTFPGALVEGNDVGVAFLKADGAYDRGGRRDNRREADLVATRVLHHFDTRPGKTLGVVALSQAQASAIDQAVQQARLARPDLDRCFTEDRLDGFFVKNLESVQGDERDVMIMSVGYGPDEHGKLGLNFGPINKNGGWRRLNVAVTRARHRMEVVASFQGGSLADSPNESVQYLKRYLEYAENGPAVLARDDTPSDAAPDSPFEESVIEVLRGWGHRVQPQVGVAGYRIDIGLRHPQLPGAYALGIECDGAMYHSSKTARDRDRLREQVLNGLGWRLHRIWGTDWYRGREAAELRLREAVEYAIAQGPLGATAGPHEEEPVSSGTPEDTGLEVEYERVPVETAAPRDWSGPYRAASVRVVPRGELHTPEARPALNQALRQILEDEGPIHEDLLVQRAREAWGVARAGTRIRDNVRTVVQALVRTGFATADGPFYDIAGRDGDLRARYAPEGETPRKIAHMAPEERHLALYELAAECPGMTQDELIKQVCEFFGWKRIGRDIRDRLEGDIAELYRLRRLGGGPGGISTVR
ncbi:DUF3320 domain-containing protein [Streptomyces hydrogenans]|uniref:DUF3320 domain-containing protein n=1 Tax=Streptomyces hydrogenans TaxID=1873719 RepID=UPI0033DD94FC